MTKALALERKRVLQSIEMADWISHQYWQNVKRSAQPVNYKSTLEIRAITELMQRTNWHKDGAGGQATYMEHSIGWLVSFDSCTGLQFPERPEGWEVGDTIEMTLRKIEP